MDRPEITERVLQMNVGRAAGIGQGKGRESWLAFSVTDGGPGIADKVRQQLFTPFFTTKPEGMGLGLSLCRTVIEQHGGALVFEPNKPQGTVFTFTLPVARPAPQTVP